MKLLYIPRPTKADLSKAIKQKKLIISLVPESGFGEGNDSAWLSGYLYGLGLESSAYHCVYWYPPKLKNPTRLHAPLERLLKYADLPCPNGGLSSSDDPRHLTGVEHYTTYSWKINRIRIDNSILLHLDDYGGPIADDLADDQ